MTLMTLAVMFVFFAVVNHALEHTKGHGRSLGAEASPLSTIGDAYVSKHEIVATWPHEHDAFTQGLAFDAHGNLYESDGLYHKSAV